MMKRITIGVQLSSIFGTALLFLVALLGVTVFISQDVSSSYQHLLQGPVPRTMALINAKDNFHSGIGDFRAYIGYNNESYAVSALENMNDSRTAIKEFASAVTTVESKREGEKLEAQLESYIKDISQVIAAKKSNDPNLNQLLMAARSNTEVINAQFESILKNQDAALKKRVTQLGDKQSFIFKLALAASLFMIALVITLLFFYSRQLTKRISLLRNELTAVSTHYCRSKSCP